DLWIGTRNGISYLNFERQAFAYLNSFSCAPTNLNNSEVYVLWEDNEKKLWMGTENGGINIFNPEANTMQYITTNQGLSNNCIKAICPDGMGNILIGTYLGGMNRYNPVTGKNKIYLHDENDTSSLSDNSIWVIYTDSQGRIWVGTYSGVDLFEPESGKFKDYGATFQVDGVSMIYEDMKNRLWMYSSDLKRLTMISPEGKVRHFPFQTRAITSSPDGYLWISTMGEGLLKFDPDKGILEKYTTREGLCSNVIYGMEKVDDNCLWLSTNNGLSRFDMSTNEFTNYYKSDGLLNNQFNYSATLKCSGNTLAFGGKKGVDFVYLSKLLKNEYIPPVVLTGLKIFNKRVHVGQNKDGKILLKNLISETDKIFLRYDQNMITFEFAALNYANSEKNTYKYKLEGFDKEWNEIGNNHSATYTNLDNGEYTFRVIGTNSDNRFDSEGLTFHLVIRPPFWKTWFFRVIIIILIGIVFYVIYLFIVNREKLKHQLYFERQNTRQLQELDRLKHKFFMNISHEIRTPLSLIIGPMEKILASDMPREKILAHVNLMKRNTAILKKLVDQLLDYRKLETGNLKLDLKQGNLSVFLQELVVPFQQLASDKSIELDFNISHKSLFFAFDSDKVEKIMNNLISNAIKYTDSGGKINISVTPTLIDELEYSDTYQPPINFEDEEIQNFVKIVVRDTGVGIPASQIQRIFDRFRQIENRHQKNTSGAGIGLSLTKELVKLHKGHIKVKSISGKGTKFTVLLPFLNQEEAERVGRENNSKGKSLQENEDLNSLSLETENQSNNHIILIIDDNPDIREFIKSHFEPEYRVITAENGKEGWVKALEQVPDLIISDIMMPVIDGVELCRKIKNDERTSHIPVIMLTALTSKEKRLAAITAGADDYIDKPFDVSLLKAKADNILYIRKSLRERFSKELLLRPKDVVIASPDAKFLRKVIQVIEKNMSEPVLDVDFLARQVGVSRTQLYRKTSALTDMAVKEFVRDIRLKRAAQLISQEKLNISEVALEVGFNDISYFRKCFKEKYGVSASKYVRTLRSDRSYIQKR
ncbi:MAG: response regulator, partial [Bacteroidales bacterium]|nr:response regulator [Bacteroidales bacterium]